MPLQNDVRRCVATKGNAVEMCLLFDFYGEMLTERQRDIFDLYYNEDMSLAEIADHAGITRQGVRDSIVRSETSLLDVEARLHLIDKFRDMRQTLSKINQITSEICKSYEYRRMSSDTTQKIAEINRLAAHMAE